MKKLFQACLSILSICCVLFFSCNIVFAQDELTAVQNIKKDLNYLISCDVSPNWEPDVRSEKERISAMVSEFKALTAAQKREFTENELSSLKQYFTTHYKNEGLDTSLTDKLFDLTIDDAPSSSSISVSSNADKPIQEKGSEPDNSKLPIATATIGDDISLLIIFSIIALAAVIGALWYMFSNQKEDPTAALPSHWSQDEIAWFVNRVNSENKSTKKKL